MLVLYEYNTYYYVEICISLNPTKNSLKIKTGKKYFMFIVTAKCLIY